MSVELTHSAKLPAACNVIRWSVCINTLSGHNKPLSVLPFNGSHSFFLCFEKFRISPFHSFFIVCKQGRLCSVVSLRTYSQKERHQLKTDNIKKLWKNRRNVPNLIFTHHFLESAFFAALFPCAIHYIYHDTSCNWKGRVLFQTRVILVT